jgi:hypothetical protein
MLFILGVEGDELIPGVVNLCAGHLCQRLQHGMEFVVRQKLLPSYNKTLVCRQKIDHFSQNKV